MPDDDPRNGDIIPLITQPEITFDFRCERDPTTGKPTLIVINVIGVDHWNQQSGPLPPRGDRTQIGVSPYHAQQLTERILRLLDKHGN